MPIFVKGHSRNGKTVKAYSRAGNPSAKKSAAWRKSHFKQIAASIKKDPGAFNWRTRAIRTGSLRTKPATGGHRLDWFFQ